MQVSAMKPLFARASGENIWTICESNLTHHANILDYAKCFWRHLNSVETIVTQRLLPCFRPCNVQTPTTLQTNQTYLDEIFFCPGSLGDYLDPVICLGVQKDLCLTMCGVHSELWWADDLIWSSNFCFRVIETPSNVNLHHTTATFLQSN